MSAGQAPELQRPPKRFCFEASEEKSRVPTSQALKASMQDITSVKDDDASVELKTMLLTSSQKQAPTAHFKEDDDLGCLQRYHCDACESDLTNSYRIKCGECQDFDLCISCFVNGVETGTHKNDHSYIPIGKNDFPIFTLDWTADEEIMLLEGVSKFGFGNWAEIGELIAPYSIGTDKRNSCEEHYYSVYIAPCREPPPAFTIPADSEEQRAEYQRRMIGKYYYPMSQPIKPSSIGNPACNIVGYMPFRGDFDVEYDNDAELILSDIDFQGDELPVDRELKLKVIDIYNARVSERVLRKKVVIEKGLVDWRRANQFGRKKLKEESDLLNIFRLLARFDLSPDYEELASLFLTERKLRQRIELLDEWRALGLKSFKDVETYEKIKSTKISGLPLTQNEIPKKINEYTTADSSGLELSHKLEAPASQYPGGNLLNEQELEFCDKLQIPPVYFIMSKYSLLNAMIEQQNSSTMRSTPTLKLDATRQGSFYDFVLHTKVSLPNQSCPAEVQAMPNIESTSTSVSREKARVRRKGSNSSTDMSKIS